MSETRRRLLDATRLCLSRDGLAAATSRQIATEAGANLASITYYFGSKDELVAEALIGALDDWLSPAIDVLTGDGEPTCRMLETIRTLTTTFEAHRGDSQLFLAAIIQAPRIPSLHQPLLDRWDQLRDLLASQIDGLRHQAILPAWVQPHAMAALLLAVATGLVVQTTVDPGGAELGDMADQFANLLAQAGPAADRDREER